MPDAWCLSEYDVKNVQPPYAEFVGLSNRSRGELALANVAFNHLRGAGRVGERRAKSYAKRTCIIYAGANTETG